jgi:hypothetical protein
MLALKILVARITGNPIEMFRPLSAWQPNDCINQDEYGMGCNAKPTQEAYFHDGKKTAAVRCCCNPICMAVAKASARRSSAKQPKRPWRFVKLLVAANVPWTR